MFNLNPIRIQRYIPCETRVPELESECCGTSAASEPASQSTKWTIKIMQFQGTQLEALPVSPQLRIQ